MRQHFAIKHQIDTKMNLNQKCIAVGSLNILDKVQVFFFVANRKLNGNKNNL